MLQPELVRQHAVLRSLIKRTGHDPSTRELEMQAHWGRYLCVLVAGFAENTVREIYSSYIRKSSNPVVARFAVSSIERVQNPKAGRLVEVAGSFNLKWAQELEKFLEDNFRGDAVDSIMTNRHLIAHGKSSYITVASVDQYLSRIVEIATFLEKQCGLV